MIPFFRIVRKKMADDNKPLKYMRYAFGEIVFESSMVIKYSISSINPSVL